MTVESAQAALDAWDAAHEIQPTDPGTLSMRFHETQARRDEALATYLARMGREARERARLETDLARAKRDAREAKLATYQPVDPAELQGATQVLVREHGALTWHRVVRVNTKTVTCAAPFRGADQPRYPHAAIVGVRHEEET